MNHIQLFTSIFILGIISVLIYLGLGQRILDRMRLTDASALIIIGIMVAGHFLPTVPLGPHLALNLGSLALVGIAAYLLSTTSPQERVRAALVSLATAVFVLLTDKLLPPDPGLLDPVFSAGIFAGLLSYLWGRSRRGAFIGGILGVYLADLGALLQLWAQKIHQPIIFGSGGLFSSAVISPFLAVLIAEIIGEVRQYLHHSAINRTGGDDSE